MAVENQQVAIVFPANATEGAQTLVERSRLAEVAKALAAAGAQVVSAPFTDDIAQEIEKRLAGVDAALVWYNPMEGDRDRSVLNRVLRSIAAEGTVVSAHPNVIDKMGTKDVLYLTRNMGWGCDTRRYDGLHVMEAELLASLQLGPRVLKQMRGQSGDGVWKVALADAQSQSHAVMTSEIMLHVRHAKRGAVENAMPLSDFLDVCRPYFATGGPMIDQPFQPRLHEGMIRCYVIRDRVHGFGEQSINALYPAPDGRPASEAPQPGPRLYFPPDRRDFQALKDKLEQEWIPQMCTLLGLSVTDLPVLWDADFLFGPKDSSGADSYVLCEINVSSVYPFPPSALAPLVAETMVRLQRHCSARI